MIPAIRSAHPLLCWMACCLVLTQFSISHAYAQSDAREIVDQTTLGIELADQAIIRQVRDRASNHELLSWHEVKTPATPDAAAAPPVASKSPALPATKTTPLEPEELAKIARQAHLRVGYCYLCPHCENWHLNLAGGYAIASNAVVTCDHVVHPDQEMQEGYLIAVNQAGELLPVRRVLAHSSSMDVAILHVESPTLVPLALNPTVQQGAEAYCFSDPMGQLGYFSHGHVNRFFWSERFHGGDHRELMTARHMRLNVSTDWAPGSSGAAVLDRCGNAIGHVAEIANLIGEEKNTSFLTLHTAVPARLVAQLCNAIAQPEKLQQLHAIETSEAPSATTTKKQEPKKRRVKKQSRQQPRKSARKKLKPLD